MKKIVLSLTCCLLISTAAFAQTANVKTQMMMDKIDRLEKDVIYLQRRVYQDASSGIRPMGSANMPAGTDELYSRISDQELVIQDLTKQVEKLTFDLTAASDKIKKLNQDVDFRFQDAEKARAADKAEMKAALDKAIADNKASATATKGTPKTPPVPPAKPGTAQAAYDKAYQFIPQNKYAEAEAAMVQFMADFPNDKLTGNANYWLGETYYARKMYQQAAGVFAAGFTAYKTNAKAPDSLFKLGMTMKHINKKTEACSAFALLPTEFPKAGKTLVARAKDEAKKLSCP